MSIGSRVLQLCTCAASAAILIGCASQTREHGTAERPVSVQEMELKKLWAGQPYKDLLAAYGQPSVIMNVPYSRQKASVVVYPVIESIPSRCAHAFTVQHGNEPVVVNYFCQ